ncbi:MAG: cytochrome c oxidase subunit 3 family protein [Porticoccaceae bacterium]
MNVSATQPLAQMQHHEGTRIPGEGGVWLFIFGDLLVFSLFFATFLFYRAENAALFDQSQAALNETYGVFNTALMLSSSWFVAMGISAVRRNSVRIPVALFSLAFLCGAGFGVVKFLEYGEKISQGINLTSNDFYMFYFLFTGIHFIHVLIGMGVLVFMIHYCRARPQGYSANDVRNMESGGCFWHVVDLLWIVLFALLYLVK